MKETRVFQERLQRSCSYQNPANTPPDLAYSFGLLHMKLNVTMPSPGFDNCSMQAVRSNADNQFPNNFSEKGHCDWVRVSGSNKENDTVADVG